MRIAIVVVLLLFVASAACDFDPVAASQVDHTRDSLVSKGKSKAIADFTSGDYEFPARGLSGNPYYAEELLYKWHGVKVEIGQRFAYTCGMGLPATDVSDSAYNGTLDSLVLLKFGNDIYARLNSGADSLEKKFPGRYPSSGWLPLEMQYDDDSVHAALLANVHYPSAAKRDSVEGTVYVAVHYDSTGRVNGTSIVKGLRTDIDSAAMAGAMHIAYIRPLFRWGKDQPGEITIPIRFKLKD